MRRRADRRAQNIFIILSILVALSMICGLAVSILRAPAQPTQPTAAPTRVIPTWTPIPRATATPGVTAPTLAPPTARPTPTS